MGGNLKLEIFGTLILASASTAFLIKWPWSVVYPNAGFPATTTLGGASINYGFLRPSILIPVSTSAATTTTTAATTTTARPTTALNQLLINALLGNPTFTVPANNSALLISLFGALAAAGNRQPIVAGLAQPFPGGFNPGVVGGVAAPITSGTVGNGGFLIPSGFPASGGVVASGQLPGLFPGIGRSAGNGVSGRTKSQSGGKLRFESR